MKEVLVKETRQGAESIVLKYVRCYDDKGRVVKEFSYKDGSYEVSNNDLEDRTILYDGLGRVSLEVQRIVSSSGRENQPKGSKISIITIRMEMCYSGNGIKSVVLCGLLNGPILFRGFVIECGLLSMYMTTRVGKRGK